MVLKEFEINFNFDLLYICYKFKLLGFVHSVNGRPISNAKYLTLVDKIIITNFSYIYFMINFWYLDCNNYLLLKSFLYILRESCILTLCRKHNKSKSWAVSVFTSNILVMKGLFTIISGLSPFDFQKKKVFTLFSSKNLFLVDEFFFLFS